MKTKEKTGHSPVITSYDLQDPAAPLLEKPVEPEAPVDTAPNPSRHPRLQSLDIYRGLTIAWMIFADNSGDAFGSKLDHSPWNNVTLADFVFPFFVFICGMSIPLSLGKTASRVEQTKKITIRCLKLFGLGLISQGGNFPIDYDLYTLRIPGILQRIAFCVFVTAMIEIWFPMILTRDRYDIDGDNDSAVGTPYWNLYIRYLPHWCAFFVITGLYLALTFGVAVPDCGRGHLDPECNAAGYIDREMLGSLHLYNSPTYVRLPECSPCSPACCDTCTPPEGSPAWCSQPFDPEGILSSFSAVTTCLLGLAFGHVIRRTKHHRDRLLQWVPLGIVWLVIGIVINFSGFPFYKNLWTTSYVFLMAGVGGCLFSCFYAVIDIWGLTKPFQPLRWMGVNAIFTFLMATTFFDPLLAGIYYQDPDNNNLPKWFREQFMVKYFGRDAGVVLFCFIKIAFWMCVDRVLYVKGIFFKV